MTFGTVDTSPSFVTEGLDPPGVVNTPFATNVYDGDLVEI